jgi:hypothetical protein
MSHQKPTLATATPAELAEAFASMKLKELHCKWCHTVFLQKKPWQEFCKPACRTTYHNGIWERTANSLAREVQQLKADLEEARRELRAFKGES